MSAVVAEAGRPRPRPGKSVWRNSVLRAVISIATFIVLWEIGSRLKAPWVGDVPPPTVVLDTWIPLLTDQGYWYSWASSRR
jgi:ABC-type nitrate/sulfonate/bicarbonate transport system permease component